MHQPPFRPGPESAQRIMRTQLIVLLLPGIWALWWFGFSALKLMVIAVAASVLTEIIAWGIRHDRSPGSTAHSVMMGLLLAFTLPGESTWYIVLIGSVGAVLVGKQLFGGLGHYLWHPVLIGRLILEIFFHEQLSLGAGMSGNGMLTGAPIEALRHFNGLQFAESCGQLGQYMLAHLPPLEQCMWGNVPGPVGQSCGVVLILVGLYFMYRSYVHWQMPAVFIGSAYLAGCVLPIVAVDPTATEVTRHVILLPILAEGIDVGFTYVNYHLFCGGLLFGAFILTADMTARPITMGGQVIFAVTAGILTMIFRLYSGIPMPCYAAMLAVSTLIPTIDRLTRHRSRRQESVKAGF